MEPRAAFHARVVDHPQRPQPRAKAQERMIIRKPISIPLLVQYRARCLERLGVIVPKVSHGYAQRQGERHGRVHALPEDALRLDGLRCYQRPVVWPPAVPEWSIAAAPGSPLHPFKPAGFAFLG